MRPARMTLASADFRAHGRRVSHLRALEAEAIHVMREVAAELERPVLLFSRRQGLDRAAAARREGVPAGELPVPGHARGHRPQLPRGRSSSATAASSELGARLIVASVQDSIDHGPRDRGDRAARLAQPPPDGDAARRDRGARLQGRLRRRPPRRGARAGEGADALVPRRLRPVGPQGPAARAVEPLQRPASARASTCACSRCRTGPSSTCGSTSPRRASSCRRSTSPTSARSSSATGCSTRPPTSWSCIARRDSLRGVGALPHGRRHELHRRGALDRRDARGRWSPRSPPRGSPSAARPAPTTA